MIIDPNAPDVYTDLSLYEPKDEGIYLVISKSRYYSRGEIPIVAKWIYSRCADTKELIMPLEGYFIHPHGGTPISATHWTTIKTKLP